MATFEDLDLLRDLHLSEEDVAFLQSKGYDSDRLRRIAGLLENKWAGVPRGLFLDDQIPAFGEVFHRGMKLVPR